MKIPNDPLLESLAEEAAALPVLAAIAARRRNMQRHQNQRRVALLACISLIGFVTWTTWPGKKQTSAEPQSLLTSQEVKSEVRATLPTGLNKEQEAFVQAAKDMPLLLVRNSSGQVTRIHLIER